jgi:hypothetical protein
MRTLFSRLPRRVGIAALAVALAAATVFGVSVAHASVSSPLSCCLPPVYTFTLVNQSDMWCMDSVSGDPQVKPCTGQLDQQWTGPDSTRRVVNYSTGYCLGGSRDRAGGSPFEFFVYLDPCTTDPVYDQQWTTVTPSCNWWSVCLPGYMVQNVTTKTCLHMHSTTVANLAHLTLRSCDAAARDQRWAVGQTFRH